MTHKLLVTVYNQDILQFKMFCYCLNKNWNGNQFITIVANSTQPYSDESWNNFFKQLTDIANKYLFNWTVEFVDGRHSDHDGYREQAVNKVVHSIDSRVHDVIVFDCKDFVLRPANLSTFKTDSCYRVTYYLPQRLIDVYDTAHELLDQDMCHIPAVINLTPSIWNVTQLEKYWKYMTNRFGHYLDWDNMYKGGTESDSYYAYTYCDPTKSIKFLKPWKTPLLVGGGWTHQTYDGILEQAELFDQNSDRIVWKHSRKLLDPRCVDVTRSVLIKHGIDQQFVEQVYG